MVKHIRSNNGSNPEKIGFLAAYSGPLPAAEQLELYEKIYPGASKILFDALAEEQKHRHEREKMESDADIESIRKFNELQNRKLKIDEKGLVSGTIICILSLCASVALAILGSPAVAAAVVAIPLASVVKALRGRN